MCSFGGISMGGQVKQMKTNGSLLAFPSLCELEVRRSLFTCLWAVQANWMKIYFHVTPDLLAD